MIAALGLVLVAQMGAANADSALLDAARLASASYQQRDAAIRAGYRKLGPEIPEMGEHWINPIMIVESKFDAARPPVLTYSTIGGKPVLTGVAYAVAVAAGEEPPATNVSGRWHDHWADVNQELTGKHGGTTKRSRVVVMHAWVWQSNPGGVFADATIFCPPTRP